MSAVGCCLTVTQLTGCHNGLDNNGVMGPTPPPLPTHTTHTPPVVATCHTSCCNCRTGCCGSSKDPDAAAWRLDLHLPPLLLLLLLLLLKAADQPRCCSPRGRNQPPAGQNLPVSLPGEQRCTTCSCAERRPAAIISCRSDKPVTPCSHVPQ